MPSAGGGSGLGGPGLAGILGCCLGGRGLESWFSARAAPSLGFPGVPGNHVHQSWMTPLVVSCLSKHV